MKKFIVRYRLQGEAAFSKVTLELPDMGYAVKAAYAYAKGIHGIPVVELHIKEKVITK